MNLKDGLQGEYYPTVSNKLTADALLRHIHGKLAVVILERVPKESKVIRNRTSLRREREDSPHDVSFSSVPHVVSNLGWTGQS